MSPASDTREQLVHIIPLGYEIDRVVTPFDEFKADRIYLISMDDLKKSLDHPSGKGWVLKILSGGQVRTLMVR